MSISNARTLRKNLTDAEKRLWQKINRRQIGAFKFRRQHPIGEYIVDFVCLERHLIVELDGGQHAAQVAYDDQRTAWLKSRGYRVLRFWNNDVMSNTDGVVEKILEAISDD
ncbi:MAG: endonuclease domain-containing protein [Betaproteobacteria bacterium]|nr:endonuclease domain-containing protein [Betaproteobacteria bacterium]